MNCISQTDDRGSSIPNSIYTYGSDCSRVVNLLDRVFGPDSSTTVVYEGVGKRIVDSFMHGMNGTFQIDHLNPGTIFAYGQTSSGKTYTMHGEDSSPGLIYLATKDIFDYMANNPNRQFILRGSYVEIYKENVRDLLNPDSVKLRIHESYDRGVYVDSKEEVLRSYDDVLNVSPVSPFQC